MCYKKEEGEKRNGKYIIIVINLLNRDVYTHTHKEKLRKLINNFCISISISYCSMDKHF